MLRKLACVLPLVGAACSFSTDVPEDETGPDAGPTPTPAPVRCQASGMALCIDFEDMPTPKDGVVPEAMISATNIVPQLRLQEGAAELAPTSQLRIADIAKLDIAQNLTIEMWTKPAQIPADSGDKQVGLFDAYGQYQMNFESDRQIECSIRNADDKTENLDSRIALTIGAWHHVACTFDGSELRVYVDGRLQGCKSTSKPITTTGTLGAAIGANMDSGPAYKNPFIGQLDNVHVYASTLSAADICALWGYGNCSATCPTGPNPKDD